MGAEEMGRVLTEATLFNQFDLSGDRVRCVAVSDAVVDEGIVFLALPEDIITQLGLGVHRTWEGLRTDAVRVEIMGREAVGEANVLIEGEPVYIGHGTLTMMDWVIDRDAKKLIGNPAHGGEHILEVL